MKKKEKRKAGGRSSFDPISKVDPNMKQHQASVIMKRTRASMPKTMIAMQDRVKAENEYNRGYRKE